MDNWKFKSVALYLVLVGFGVLVGIPVISTAWVGLLGFTEEQVGRVAGADLGGTSQPARAFNIMLFLFAFSQVVELYVLPKFSMNGVYMVFIGCFMIWLLFLCWMPAWSTSPNLDAELEKDDPDGGKHDERQHIPVFVPWLVLSAIFFTYINIVTYWTNIELASLDAELAGDWAKSLDPISLFPCWAPVWAMMLYFPCVPLQH